MSMLWMFSMLYIDVMNVFNVWLVSSIPRDGVRLIEFMKWYKYPFINCQRLANKLKYKFTLLTCCWTPSISKSAFNWFLRRLAWIRWDFLDTGSRLSGTEPTNPFSLASWSSQDTHYTVPLSSWELNPEDIDLTMFKIQNLTGHVRQCEFYYLFLYTYHISSHPKEFHI